MSSHPETFPLIPRRRIAGIAFGGMRSTRRGPGSDVVGSRPYLPTDDRRRIDQRASARLSLASGTEQLLVREHHIEEGVRVIVVVDRRPAMALYPPPFHWIKKPKAIIGAGRLIVRSAKAAHCLVGYLDYADALHPNVTHRSPEPFWRPPNAQTEAGRIMERNLPHPNFYAKEENLADAIGELISFHRGLPAGTFLFFLSDFLVSPPTDVWKLAVAQRWDTVAVVIQDPVWEQSFPIDCAGETFFFVDPRTGRSAPVRFTKKELIWRREEHEQRLMQIVEQFTAIGVDSLILSSDDDTVILREFCQWSDDRRFGKRR